MRGSQLVKCEIAKWLGGQASTGVKSGLSEGESQGKEAIGRG